MLPEAESYGTLYHNSYKVNPENLRKRLDWKKMKKKSGKLQHSNKQKKLELLFENEMIQCAPEIEIPSNASAFAVFASVRLAVLDRWMRNAVQEHLQSSCSLPAAAILDQSEFESDIEDNTESSTYIPVKVSKIVGLGLKSVFELIKESRTSHPVLCTKSLLALLDVLQGQTPEGLKSEPSDIIDPLFELLLDLATLHGPESTVLNDGNHLTAVACACLLSLVVVRGDTGKYLSAAAALLMCPRALSIQNIKMPAALSCLQRSIHGVLLGKMVRPDWLTHGVPLNSKIDSFNVKIIPPELETMIHPLVGKSLAFDGEYLYVFFSKGLLKIGSGYGGSVKGLINIWKPDFYPNDSGSLVFCSGKLYLKLDGRRGGEFLIVDKTTLLITGSVPLHSRDVQSPVVFSDGDYLGTISAAKDNGFVVRLLNQNVSPAAPLTELPLKLARKCLETLGHSFEADDSNNSCSSPIILNTDEEIATVCAGKEFGLLRTVSGKVFYSGKSLALGIKQAGMRLGKWSELILTKSPKIQHIFMGHDGLHAILIADDGAVFFTGTARRGEDGDQNKVRRQPKPVKPKKIIKVDGLHVVIGACNNGTTALVTKDGELLMFGKDTSHADSSTGLVTALKGEFITQISLGKAHAVALTSKGQIFTFGINNKFQCGREFLKPSSSSSTKDFSSSSSNNIIIAMDTGSSVQEENNDYFLEDLLDMPQKESDLAEGSEGNLGEEEQQEIMCPSGAHIWREDLCMICTVCGECTGYSISCLSSVSSERHMGEECGCGEGDSGCALCGCCRICAKEVVDNSELADLAGMLRDKKLVPAKQRFKLLEQNSRFEERKTKSNKKSISAGSSSKQASKVNKSSRTSILATPTHKASSANNQRQNNSLMMMTGTVKEQTGSDVERDAARIACLPPAKLILPSEGIVLQIACGLHHSVLLLKNGQVLTFGSNIYGQLGCGDILAKNTIQNVKLHSGAVHVAAGSNHTVILTNKGEVFTFGNAEKGQLGRLPILSNQESCSTSKYNNSRTPWYSIPGAIPNIGPRHGRKATWVGASGDQTFLKLDESLINSVSISKSTVTANKHCIMLFPNYDESSKNFKTLVINKKDGNCNSFKGPQQEDFSSKMIYMDPIYNILWSYDINAHKVNCYNIIAAELQSNFASSISQSSDRVLSDVKIIPDNKFANKFENLNRILSSELALPISTNCHVTRFQAALNLLCCLDTLTTAHDLQIYAVKEEIDKRHQLVPGKPYSKEDFQAVNRFESHGGGWGYSGHSIEAIRFMADTDIILGGFGLFGGRGEYTAKLKLLDIGPNGGEQEIDGEVLAETEEVMYECGPRQKYAMLFDEPVQLQAHRWYVAWCRISGPSSDCGSSGQSMVTTEDQVLFYFKSSKKSNNGTDVNAGQIPQLLYKIISPENQTAPSKVDVIEPIHILSKEFSRTVTKDCFNSLLSLLQWSWNTFKWGIMEGQSIKTIYTNLELERLVYISTASLRLLCTYTNEIYPRQINRKSPLDNVHLAECIGDIRTLLKQILADSIPTQIQAKKCSKSKTLSIVLMKKILEECHNTFVNCFHAFYPTAYLKWTCLCDLLAETDHGEAYINNNTHMLLSAVLCALCAPSVRLRSTFPLLGNNNQSVESSLNRGLSPSDNTGHPIMSVSDSHNYPILVEQMSYKSQMESNYSGLSWTWADVLERLLNLISDPIMKILQNKESIQSLSEVSKYCCHLLARVLAELVHQCSSTEEELESACGRILHMTPSRFTRTNQSRTWNTGNGSPDAICFEVDRGGISIVGVGIYGGIGHYEYELELLEDTSLGNGIENHAAHRWNSLEITRGSFGPEDFAPDIVEIKFDRAVSIKENTKYAIRLRNHGGRTNNGDGGLNSIKGSDNTTFTFSTCSISFNGTTITRGQIPILLYYSSPLECGKSTSKLEYLARKTALSMTTSIIENCVKLLILSREKIEEVPSVRILNESCIISTLLPLVLAHISPLASSDPKSAVQVLALIQELLPHVAALNLMDNSQQQIRQQAKNNTQQENWENKIITTTSNHSTWVESDHPYKSATVANYRVLFPENIKWMSLEFDPTCSTAQPEDSLQLYIPAINFARNNYKKSTVILNTLDDLDSPPLPYWPILHKFSGSLQWPTNSVILPGNEVVFSLETASDYLKDDRASAYGFKCLVIGFEWLPEGNFTELKHLEAELAFLGGMCAASLMKKDLMLPVIGDEADMDMEGAEGISSEIFVQHNALLSKGLALSSPPTVTQALEGILPYSTHSNERLFLRDFVGCVPGSSGGRFAQWLQPGSHAEPSLCKIHCVKDDLRQGWPAILSVFIRDQYGDAVYVPNMKVEVKAIPIDKKELAAGESSDNNGRKIRRVSQIDQILYGGLPPPPLHLPYEATIRDKMRFHSITVMKPFQNYSFEELRFTSPPVKRSSETMLVRANLDGTYNATWTPASEGCYSISVNIDGYEMEEMFKVEVKEPPQGVIPPNQNASKKSSSQPNKIRKFVAKNSAGLRVRAHPSLQSEQIGIVHINETIIFIDEIHNDDGIWLRLSADTIRQYCNAQIIEAWCLQYNQHLGKTLLLPVEEPKTVLEQVLTDTIMRRLPEIQDKSKTSQVTYKVIKCGASGHNVRKRPSLKASPIGMLILGNRLNVSEYVINSEGCWVLLDKATKEKYCFNLDDEAWSLAIGINNVLYLDNVSDDAANKQPKVPERCPFQFSYTKSTASDFAFANNALDCKTDAEDDATSSNPFIFGDNMCGESSKGIKKEFSSGKSKSKSKFTRNDSNNIELISGSNGNGTPPDTPKKTQKSISRSASPAFNRIPARENCSRTIGVSPLASGTPTLERRGSSQSDTIALISSIPRDQNQSKNLSATPSGSSNLQSTRNDEEPKKLTQTGTQTSPENPLISIKSHFSMGTHKEEKLSPKMMRKDRGGASSKNHHRPKRTMSPAASANMHQISSVSTLLKAENQNNCHPVKEAMSPSVAEALRAVFAAFLWHEGIVHDAMACASFLKFHPSLPKQGVQVVTRHQEFPLDKRHQELTKEERARQRHSVEVSNAGNYLHIQPSTLESLTRSAANASANRNRRKMNEGIIIKEDSSSSNYNNYQTISVLPPALKSLVYLWEELTSSCLQQMTNNEHVIGIKTEKIKTDKIDAKIKNNSIEKESKRLKKKKVPPRNYLEDIGLSSYLHLGGVGDTLCELCGDSFPHPVTYHMHQEHPGCGQHAGGKGYNSGGNYCLGWAGNCGDGGVAGSSWYLLCEQCREKCMKNARGNNKQSSAVMKAKNVIHHHKKSLLKSGSEIRSVEQHIIMKNNAMFLLELASSSDTSLTSQRRTSIITSMPSVSENITPPDCSGPFGPLPPFQCLNTFGGGGGDGELFIQQISPPDFKNLQNVASTSSGQRPLSEVSLSESETDAAKGMKFHRSVSMGMNGVPWTKSGLDGRVMMMRRRNNSSSEFTGEGGSSLLCNPSSALQKLLPKEEISSIVKQETSQDTRESLNLLKRPALQFMIQHHDLESLRICMKQALRKAMCRVYAMQALNWLLRSVTQPICLHDLLWWFVTSLTPIDIEMETEDDNRPPKRCDEDLNVCEHPLSDISIAGEAVHPLPGTFHSLLQTIANLMVLLPMGSSLQQISVRCWGLRFAPADHSFLHRSQVFNNISKILSRSEEMEDFTISMHESALNHPPSAIVECLKDLTHSVELRASSRQAMIASLTDGSTETFWESGDEDRNKTKSITIICAHGHHPVLICLHVDNCRDLGNKISTITFFSGQNSDELVKLRSLEVETRLLGGWVNCPILELQHSVIRLELKGPDNSVRVRQIRILGQIDGEYLKVGKLYNAATIQQRNCEAETLRVFRLITAQVFGKLLHGEVESSAAEKTALSPNNIETGEPLVEESNDLREHMVGILFSRSKLTHLQKQVIVHIVQAIRKETERVREEWENNLCTSSPSVSSNASSDPSTGNSDIYCFEMLSMVLALSGSSVGRAYLSHQGGFLGDLLTLLHIGSARVQRQVISLLRRILPEISPQFFAKVLGVPNLPAKDFNIVSFGQKDSTNYNNKFGILDIFLSVIAKNLTLQVKMRNKSGSSSKEISTVNLSNSISMEENVDGIVRWWLKGNSNRKLAELILELIKDMSSGKMSEHWSTITKGAIAENILNLTFLNEEQRLPTNCLKTATLWLALASLCVLDKDHVERLSSGQWNRTDSSHPLPPRPMCSNHDDGETTAVIQCNSCGNLCADCDRFLHLHRKTRSHLRQVCKEEEEAIKVELHEGCGRTKLFWLLALADSRTLKALVEYREGGARSRAAGITGICRFCGTTGNSGLLAIGNVCADSECQEYGKTACTKLLNCGHMCGGTFGETDCLSCLHGCSNDSTLRQDSDDMCMICFTEALSCAPAIQLRCGHVFHLHCCKTVLVKKWAGPRITFSFSLCPICKAEIHHATLEDLLQPIQELFKDVKRKALMRLEYEGLHVVDAVMIPGARFYNDPASYAMDRYAYYVCFKCHKAYYGGEARCDAEAGDRFDPSELVCGACSDVARAQMCPKHGADFLEYKCRYCCSVAVFFCFGTTHFCNLCHDDFQRVTNLAKSELPVCPAGARATQLEGDECPLHVKHPSTGEEFALGCGVCRNAHTF